MNSNALSGRTISAFPLSVGTCLAIESIFEGGGTPLDPERQIPQKVQISDYTEFWLNLGTLFRNMFNAVANDEVERLRPSDCADAMLSEMELLDSLTKSQSGSLTKTQYYICNFRGLPSKYPRAKFRTLTTSKQLFYKSLFDKTLQMVIDRYGGFRDDGSVQVFDVDLSAKFGTNALILTHVPHDLTCAGKFNKLHMIESHTGVLKKANTWYTKYYKGKDLMMMPFNKVLLPVLGDNETFSPISHKLREDLIQLAKDCNWTFATTIAKVQDDVKKLRDPYARTIILGSAT